MVHFIELELYVNNKIIRIEINRIGIMEEYPNYTEISESVLGYLKGRYFQVKETAGEITDKIAWAMDMEIEFHDKEIDQSTR